MQIMVVGAGVGRGAESRGYYWDTRNGFGSNRNTSMAS